MSVTKINPPELYASVPFGFSHAALQEGGRTLHLAGQVAWDSNHKVVGEGDLAKQAEVALQNLKAVLAASGADASNVVRLRTYIVDNTPEKLGVVVEAIKAFYGDVTPAPNTVISVPGLALPEFLIEIEGTACLQ